MDTTDRNYQASRLVGNQSTFDPIKSPAPHTDSLTGFQERARSHGDFAGQQHLNAFNLAAGNWKTVSLGAYKTENSPNLNYLGTHLRWKRGLKKRVAGKERHLDDFASVTPAPYLRYQGQIDRDVALL
jgi:hypothetical protein